MASFHTSQESFPSDRLIGVWVVTKKDSILLSCLSCKVKSFFLKKKNFIKMSSSRGLRTCPLALREYLQILRVKSCHVRVSLKPLSDELSRGHQPESLLRWGGGHPGPAGHQMMLPNLTLVPEMPLFFFNTSRENKN